MTYRCFWGICYRIKTGQTFAVGFPVQTLRFLHVKKASEKHSQGGWSEDGGRVHIQAKCSTQLQISEPERRHYVC